MTTKTLEEAAIAAVKEYERNHSHEWEAEKGALSRESAAIFEETLKFKPDVVCGTSIMVDDMEFEVWDGKVRLMDTCPECGLSTYSIPIRGLVELGYQLIEFDTHVNHHCPGTDYYSGDDIRGEIDSRHPDYLAAISMCLFEILCFLKSTIVQEFLLKKAECVNETKRPGNRNR